MPSTPNIPPGLSLDRDGVHFRWVRERSREIVESYIEAGKAVKCYIWDLGRSWDRFDYSLGVLRTWQEGEALAWFEDEV